MVYHSISICLLIAFSTVVNSAAVSYTLCGGDATVVSVDVEPLSDGKPYIDVGVPDNFTVTFRTALRIVQGSKVTVKTVLHDEQHAPKHEEEVKIPVKFEDRHLCDHISLECPVEAGQTVTFTGSANPPRAIASEDVFLQWDFDSPEEKILCIRYAVRFGQGTLPESD